MIIRWFRQRRRQQILSRPAPADWEQTLAANVRDYGIWPAERRALLLDRIKLLIAEKYWEGCKGLEVNPEIQVTIAAHAARLTLGWPQPSFNRLSRVPRSFVTATARNRS
jgi:Mlc titration factor MtfA (ptsG expression regulator)